MDEFDYRIIRRWGGWTFIAILIYMVGCGVYFWNISRLIFVASEGIFFLFFTWLIARNNQYIMRTRQRKSAPSLDDLRPIPAFPKLWWRAILSVLLSFGGWIMLAFIGAWLFNHLILPISDESLFVFVTITLLIWGLWWAFIWMQIMVEIVDTYLYYQPDLLYRGYDAETSALNFRKNFEPALNVLALATFLGSVFIIPLLLRHPSVTWQSALFIGTMTFLALARLVWLWISIRGD